MATLVRAGLDLDSATVEVLDFLATYPQYLLPTGEAELAAMLARLGAWGLPRPLQAVAVARCPALLRTAPEELEEVAGILLGFGMTGQQLADIVAAYPAVLRSRWDAGLCRVPVRKCQGQWLPMPPSCGAGAGVSGARC